MSRLGDVAEKVGTVVKALIPSGTGGTSRPIKTARPKEPKPDVAPAVKADVVKPPAPLRPPVNAPPVNAPLPKPLKPPKPLPAVAGIRMGALVHMLRAELAASQWFQKLSAHEQEAYRAAHPDSKFTSEHHAGRAGRYLKEKRVGPRR